MRSKPTQNINNNTTEQYLTVSCFGDFNVTIEDNKERIKWRTKKAQELFAYLVHLQGNPVERKTLIKQLWPRDYPDNAVVLLHNIIYSIRKEFKRLGINNLIWYKNGYYYIDMQYIHSNISDMLSIGYAIENKDKKTILKYEKFLKYYLGSYFNNIECEWNCALMEYYDNTYVKACKEIAETKIKEQDYETAIHYLYQALQADPFSEIIASLLIECYGKKRDYKNMKKFYEKFMKNLKEELDIEVSEMLDTAFKESRSI